MANDNLDRNKILIPNALGKLKTSCRIERFTSRQEFTVSSSNPDS